MHPILFNIGPLEIRAYGVLTALAFLTAIYMASMLAKKRGMNPDIIFDMGLVVIMTSIVGARLLYVIVWWKYFGAHPVEIFKIWEGGLVFYGGAIAGFFGGLAWVKYKKLPALQIADICLPFVALAHAIGRIGCWFNACCYGAVNEQFGVIFPALGDNLKHYPTQLYESAMNFLNFVVLILFFRNKKRKDGDVLFMYCFNYGIIRMVVEIFRGDPERGTVMFMSTSQFISAFLIATGIVGFIYLRVRKKAA